MHFVNEKDTLSMNSSHIFNVEIATIIVLSVTSDELKRELISGSSLN